MMNKGYENRYQVTMVSVEDLVPQDHLLRQISVAVDFSEIYEFVEELYCGENGFVLETVVTSGNVYDSVAFDDVYDKLAENYPEICRNCPTRHLCTEAKDCVKNGN